MADQSEADADPSLIDLKTLECASEFLKTLAHPHRLRILQMLVRGRYTVGELAAACNIPSHMASEHLRMMQWMGLLSPEREGRRTYYQIADSKLPDFIKCVESRFGGLDSAPFCVSGALSQARHKAASTGEVGDVE